MAEIKGYFIDVANEQARPVTVEYSLESFYKLLNCDMIDITPRRIGRDNRLYDIICDEEGLLKGAPIVSAYTTDNEPVLVGSLLIVNIGEGDLESLKPDDIKYIRDYVCDLIDLRKGTIHPILTQCDYA